jgi:hypothetical protein
VVQQNAAGLPVSGAHARAALAPIALSVPVHVTPYAPEVQSVIASACTQLLPLVMQQYEVPPVFPTVSQSRFAVACEGVSAPEQEYPVAPVAEQVTPVFGMHVEVAGALQQ